MVDRIIDLVRRECPCGPEDTDVCFLTFHALGYDRVSVCRNNTLYPAVIVEITARHFYIGLCCAADLSPYHAHHQTSHIDECLALFHHSLLQHGLATDNSFVLK